jgi:hypothetical protein
MEMEQQPRAQARAEPWAAGRRAEAKDLSDTIAIVLAITIAALFVSVLLNTIAFPRGTHPDEIAKAVRAHAPESRLFLRPVQAALSRSDRPAELCLLQSGHQDCRARRE